MMAEADKYVLGIDYGTDSVRALVINAFTGKEEADEVFYYPRWKAGRYCDSAENRFRQHPLDYIEGLIMSVTGALAKMAPGTGNNVIGIGVDTTGSTPCAVDRSGTPLGLKAEFRDNPNAMFVLWKDHTAVAEAGEINRSARNWGGTDFTKYEGGVYSSEWFWSKILHILREDKAVRENVFSWVEHCDWIPALLTGTTDPLTMKRSRCAAGHKAMWHAEWGGLPDERFLAQIDPLLQGIKNRLFKDTCTADIKVGGLTAEWADKLGLKEGTAVAAGALDCHMGAVGAKISRGTLVKIMGTSTCDVMVVPPEIIGGKLIAGICGQVDGSVVPGQIGLEAGQSAYGDVYAWFRSLLSWPLKAILADTTLVAPDMIAGLRAESEAKILAELSREASTIDVESSGLTALDWLNGRRTPFADQTLKGAVIGLTLGTTAPRLFRALVEATAFGSKAIAERLREEGVEINQVIAIGGIAKKNDFVMQVACDVLNMPIKVAESEQACALGAGLFGAVVSGLYANVVEAQARLGSSFSKVYHPNPENARKYERLYQKYLTLGKKIQELIGGNAMGLT